MSTTSEQPAAAQPAAPRLTFAALVAMAPWSLSLAVLLAALSAALALLPLLLFHQIAAEVMAPTVDLTQVRWLAGYAVAAVLVRWVLMSVSHSLAHWGAFTVLYRLRQALADRLAVVPMALLARHGSGGIRKTVIDDVGSMEGFLAHMLPDTAAAVVTPPLALAVLFWFDWRLGLAALSPLPLLLVLQGMMIRDARASVAEWHDLQTRISGQTMEYLRGMPVVKLFGLTARSFGDFSTAVLGAVDWVGNYARRLSGGWAFFNGLTAGGLVVVMPVGLFLFSRGEVTAPTLILFVLMTPLVLQPLSRLTYALGEQERRRGALERIGTLLDAPGSDGVSRTAPAAVIPRDIVFDNVHFAYDSIDNGETAALAGISFTAAAGQVTALVGPSGAGKTTIMRLLARHADPCNGAIRVAGRDIRDWPTDTLLAEYATVFQDVFLFHGTIRDNLRIARADADDQALERAARAACAHDFIAALPDGYDTPLGERGSRLSGGERQRLSVARALLKNAPILLLDEATSAADAENEALIQQGISRLCHGRTVLVIAHRLNSVRHADRIIVLDQGTVTAQGTHEALMEHCPLYRNLWLAQERAAQWQLNRTTTANRPC